MKKMLITAATALTLMLQGCATIVGDAAQTVPITSTPSDAHISIKDEKGLEIYAGQTPTTVTLQKSDGSYFGGKHYTVEILKDGYRPQTITVDARVNGWYLGGNLIFGGLIGWLIVDPLTGKMYKLSSESITATLPTNTTANNTEADGIHIALLQDLSPQLREKLIPING
nr:hypothetical protein [uncultured Tolumonas sp.]